MKKKALITGITGQDGSYLAELLLEKGYEVHGMKRASSSFNTGRIDHLYKDPHVTKNNFYLHYGDMTDTSSIMRAIKQILPDEIYNLAAQSHVAISFEQPEYTANTVALGTLRILETIKILNLQKKIKFYQASTSELFGKTHRKAQTELTPFYPRSPYAAGKLYAYWITVNYREAYNIYACNGILFNHESPRRGETFVTRKITLGFAKMFFGLQENLFMGNLDAKRDWGHAKDYVYFMWLMMQQKKPEDFVISTGVHYSVRQFINKVANFYGLEIKWINKGINEKAKIINIRKKSMFGLKHQFKINQVIVRVAKDYYRPTEVDWLLGDSSKARKKLKWKPKYSFIELVKEMATEDFYKIQNRHINKINFNDKKNHS